MPSDSRVSPLQTPFTHSPTSLDVRYFYFATDERKRNPDYYGSNDQDPELGDPEDEGDATDNEEEEEDEPDDDLPNDPESRSWILPDRTADEDDVQMLSSSKARGKRPIIDDSESDTLSESSEREDEDPYDFGVLSVSDDEMIETQTRNLDSMSDGGQPANQAVSFLYLFPLTVALTCAVTVSASHVR